MTKKQTIRRVLDYLRPYGVRAVLSLCLAAASVALTLYVPILTGQGVDLLAEPGKVDFSSLAGILLRMGLAAGGAALAQWLMNLCNQYITLHTVKSIRSAAFEKLQQLPISVLDAHSSGDTVSRVISDVDQLSDGLLLGFTQLFTGVITILGTFGFMLSVNVPVTLVVVLITPVSLVTASFIARRTYSMFTLQSSARGEQTALIQEMVRGQKTVRAFGREAENLRHFDEVNDRLTSYSLRATFFSSLTNPTTRFVNGLVYAGVAVVGALFSIAGSVSVGQLTCFLSYANQFTKPFNEISGVVTELQNALACASRVFELIDSEPEKPDSPDAKHLENFEGRVELRHIRFSYSPEKVLFKDLNLEAASGTRVAIVGATGCGKTTLINLLLRFYEPDSGSILLDGMETSQITRQALRAGFGMVLQDTWLKTATVLENLTMGKPDATREVAEAAAKLVHAHSFISRLPQGYDTVIENGGESLSQGQRQLLCMARVMLCRPPMLILDEATSSIDARTEQKIQDALAALMEGRTCFIVAHRLSTIQNADQILMMDHGAIVERGTHEELLAKNGAYARLYRSQFAPTMQKIP